MSLLFAINEPLGFIETARGVLISSFITIMSLIPGGYIIKEATLTLFLINEGISLDSAILVSLFDRLFSTIFSFLFGGISSIILLKMGKINKSLKFWEPDFEL